METLYNVIVGPDSRIRLQSSVKPEKGLEVFVFTLYQEFDLAISGLTLARDWLNSEEDEAWSQVLQRKGMPIRC
jgi:hypothetical protein